LRQRFSGGDSGWVFFSDREGFLLENIEEHGKREEAKRVF